MIVEKFPVIPWTELCAWQSFRLVKPVLKKGLTNKTSEAIEIGQALKTTQNTELMMPGSWEEDAHIRHRSTRKTPAVIGMHERHTDACSCGSATRI